jgi:hypothetical protein
VAWRKAADPFPAPLRCFREADWPPVPGECLGHYTCRRNGYGGDCGPRPGEPCGQACYAMLAREYPGPPRGAGRCEAGGCVHPLPPGAAVLAW